MYVNTIQRSLTFEVWCLFIEAVLKDQVWWSKICFIDRTPLMFNVQFAQYVGQIVSILPAIIFQKVCAEFFKHKPVQGSTGWYRSTYLQSPCR